MPLPPRRSSASSSSRANGSASEPASAPKQACRNHVPFSVGDPLHVEGDEALGRLPRVACTFSERRVPSPGSIFSGTASDAVRRGDQRRAVGRDEAALMARPASISLGGDTYVDVALRRHSAKTGAGRCPATSRHSRSSRRCAARRRRPKSTARTSRCARRRR